MGMNSYTLKKQEKKVEAIRAAIKKIYEDGSFDFSNSEIVRVVGELYQKHPDKDYIVHNQLLYKPYYKDNLKKWINELTGIRNAQLKQSLQKAHEVKAELVQERYQKLRRDSFKIVNKILKGEIKYKKFTKSFLIEEVNKLYKREEKELKQNNNMCEDNNTSTENKNREAGEYATSIFSDEKYEPIYHDAYAKLYTPVMSKDSGETQKILTILEYNKLKQEKERLLLMNRHLAHNKFLVYEGDEELLSENDVMYSKLMSTNLDTSELFAYLHFLETKVRGQKSINAYQLLNVILQNVEEVKIK